MLGHVAMCRGNKVATTDQIDVDVAHSWSIEVPRILHLDGFSTEIKHGGGSLSNHLPLFPINHAYHSLALYIKTAALFASQGESSGRPAIPWSVLR